MSKKYPKVLFVQTQGDGEDEYFQAERDFVSIPDDGQVAVYELKEVKNRKTKVSID